MGVVSGSNGIFPKNVLVHGFPSCLTVGGSRASCQHEKITACFL